MIEPMKKVTLLAGASWEDEILNALRETGIFHIRLPENAGAPDVTIKKDVTVENRLGNNMLLIQEALGLIPQAVKAKPCKGDEDGIVLARELCSKTKEAFSLEAQIQELEKAYEDQKIWGQFDPHDIEQLKDHSIFIRLFKARKKELGQLPADIARVVIHTRGAMAYFAVVTCHEPLCPIPFHEISMPEQSLSHLARMLEQKREALETIQKRILELYGAAPYMARSLNECKALLAYENARNAMVRRGDIIYLQGYCPTCFTGKLKERADIEKWGIVIENPGPEETVPSLVRYSKLTHLFRPVMAFIGVLPGYREYDANGPFLFFFTLFFAMIIGDAGYGVMILAATFFHAKRSAAPHKDLIPLLYLLSLSTMVWGALTGSWFGVEALRNFPLFKAMIIPSMDTFSDTSQPFIIHLCFLIGAVQLSFAHCRRILNTFPHIRFLAETGWFFLIWAIYFIVRVLVLNQPFSPLGYYCLIAALCLIICFGQQKEDGFFKGLARSVVRLPLDIITWIGNLSDLVSYVRLFAVGMSTKEVAVAFNNMAFNIGFDTLPAMFSAVLVLLGGHSVNLLLGAMAILVHGIRLNVLEFSKHLNIEWSGVPYDPFREPEP
ncbi:hypothetical protein [Desulfobacter vibrioformis]|uniref:hypothetical protein n=1 Tax=Desulfobacter vibrioformis TaxID=34031 RepID=UPI0005522804|nr:hypothetical protein [Desulfobacter vibrioformis]